MDRGIHLLMIKWQTTTISSNTLNFLSLCQLYEAEKYSLSTFEVFLNSLTPFLSKMLFKLAISYLRDKHVPIEPARHRIFKLTSIQHQISGIR